MVFFVSVARGSWVLRAGTGTLPSTACGEGQYQNEENRDKPADSLCFFYPVMYLNLFSIMVSYYFYNIVGKSVSRSHRNQFGKTKGTAWARLTSWLSAKEWGRWLIAAGGGEQRWLQCRRPTSSAGTQAGCSRPSPGGTAKGLRCVSSLHCCL